MITFKQFLKEKVATPGNVDSQFTVGDVQFDNQRGLGSTPNNANVEYMGCVAFMKPSQFRKLAHKADRSEDAKKLENLIRDGGAIGCPFLDISITEKNDAPVQAQIKGHEGRARAEAFMAVNGDVLMPVHLFFRGSYNRARDITPELLHWIAKTGIVPEEGGEPIPARFAHVFLQGQTITL